MEKETNKFDNHSLPSSSLLCFAIDLSGSMKTNIKNNTKDQITRLQSFYQVLDNIAKQIETHIKQETNLKTFVDLFMYGFGFRELEVCDLLSLIKFKNKLINFNQNNTYSNGYEDLKKIAQKYNIEDWYKHACNDNLFDQKGAALLAKYLGQNQDKALELKHLLSPKGIFDSCFSKYNAFERWYSGEVEQAKELIKEWISLETQEIFKANINEIGNVTIKLEDLPSFWNLSGQDKEYIETLIYGNTPMCKALSLIKDRFEEEKKTIRFSPHQLVLFLVSDGEPTDGNPLIQTEKLKSLGITIISCFIAPNDIVAPKVLFSKAESHWSAGAKLMFDAASYINEQSPFIVFLQQKNWVIGKSAKLFVQLNHSEILEEVIQAILIPAKEALLFNSKNLEIT